MIDHGRQRQQLLMRLDCGDFSMIVDMAKRSEKIVGTNEA